MAFRSKLVSSEKKQDSNASSASVTTTFFLNQHKVQTVNNTTIFQASFDLGLVIAQFCYNKKLNVAGNCRMCLIELLNSIKPIASCSVPVLPNNLIFLESPLTKKAQGSVLELVLENHPIDCPICDQGGECDLQNQVMDFGSAISRNFSLKKAKEEKNFGPLIKTLMTRCIECTRCVRFSSQISSFEFLGMVGRGAQSEISAYKKAPMTYELAGNITDYCPVWCCK